MLNQRMKEVKQALDDRVVKRQSSSNAGLSDCSEEKSRVVCNRTKGYCANRRLHRIHDVYDSRHVIYASSWAVHVKLDFFCVVHVFKGHQGAHDLRCQHVVKKASDKHDSVLKEVRHHIHSPFFTHGNNRLYDWAATSRDFSLYSRCLLPAQAALSTP